MSRLIAVVPVLGSALLIGGCDLYPVCADRGEGMPTEGCVVLNRAPEVRIEMGPSQRPVVGDRVRFEAVATDPDNDQLYFEWDLDGDGEYDREGYDVNYAEAPRADRVDHVYGSRGRKTVTLRVSDFPKRDGGEGATIATRRFRVFSQEEFANDQPPVAEFTVAPNPAGVGEAVRFDASASRDPDIDQVIVSYEWDFDGDGAYDLIEDDPIANWSFDSPGDRTVHLHVVGELGGDAAVSHATQTVSVTGEGGPLAALTVSPNPAALGQSVTFDASGSQGQIATYEFDLDGENGYEVRTNGPIARRPYYAPGNFLVRVRVTDSQGRISVAEEEMRIVGDGRRAGARSERAAGAPGPRLQLAAEIDGRKMRARLRNLPGEASRAERSLRRFLSTRWRPNLRIREDPARGLVVRGVALGAVGGRSGPRVCVRLRAAAPAGSPAEGRFRIIGGRGRGSRLRGGGELRAALRADGAIAAVGDVRVRRGAPRGLPRRCARLARGTG